MRENGAVFDQNARASLPVDGVIAGFSEGLQMMKSGSIYRFCIPGALAYGPEEIQTPMATIPANGDLVFQVELIGVQPGM